MYIYTTAQVDTDDVLYKLDDEQLQEIFLDVVNQMNIAELEELVKLLIDRYDLNIK